MEKHADTKNTVRFKLPAFKWNGVVRFLVVAGLTATGMGMMAAGLLAWVVGETALLITGVVGGAVFVSAGGLGTLRCLDEMSRQSKAA